MDLIHGHFNALLVGASSSSDERAHLHRRAARSDGDTRVEGRWYHATEAQLQRLQVLVLAEALWSWQVHGTGRAPTCPRRRANADRANQREPNQPSSRAAAIRRRVLCRDECSDRRLAPPLASPVY